MVDPSIGGPPYEGPPTVGPGGACWEEYDEADGKYHTVCMPVLSGGSTTNPPPRVPCDIDAGRINAYIKGTPIYGNPALSKPLEGMGDAFIDAALKYDTDPRMVLAIGFWESHWGYDTKAGGSNNAFGMKDSKGLLRFASWQSGISGATKSVNSAYSRGNLSISDLYSGLPGAYCTHAGCTDAIPTLERIVTTLGGDPNYLGFDCERVDGVLVKKE